MAVFHYSRVSLEEQTTENQKLVVESSGYSIDHWYSDKGVSGGVKALDRPEFAAMFAQLTQGSVLVVNSVDRIGRDTIDVLSTIDACAAKGAKVCVLAYGNLDLTSEMGRVIVTMAAAFAQLERSYLKTRTRSGMARTKAAGTKLGPPLKIAPDTLEQILVAKGQGLTLEKISNKFSIPRNTLQKNVAKWGNNLQGYRQEYDSRVAQHSTKKLAISVRMI